MTSAPRFLSSLARGTARFDLLAVALLGAAGCESSNPERTSDAALAADTGAEPVEEERCVAPDGVSSSPRSIKQVVTLLNALPRPVTLQCFLESLSRPLALHAAESVFSAQPAVGKRSPRIFLFLDPLILSIVPEGMGAHLLEFGERRANDRSLKAELEFPIREELDSAAPYRRLPFDDTLTSCGFCHQGEAPAPDSSEPFAFLSQALRPVPSQRVLVQPLFAEYLACDASLEPERCAILDGLFAQDPLPIDRDFPTTFATFF